MYNYNMEKATKQKVLPVRLTEREYKVASERAEALGLSISAYIRLLINQDRERQRKSALPGA